MWQMLYHAAAIWSSTPCQQFYPMSNSWSSSAADTARTASTRLPTDPISRKRTACGTMFMETPSGVVFPGNRTLFSGSYKSTMTLHSPLTAAWTRRYLRCGGAAHQESHHHAYQDYSDSTGPCQAILRQRLQTSRIAQHHHQRPRYTVHQQFLEGLVPQHWDQACNVNDSAPADRRADGACQ